MAEVADGWTQEELQGSAAWEGSFNDNTHEGSHWFGPSTAHIQLSRNTCSDRSSQLSLTTYTRAASLLCSESVIGDVVSPAGEPAAAFGVGWGVVELVVVVEGRFVCLMAKKP